MSLDKNKKQRVWVWFNYGLLPGSLVASQYVRTEKPEKDPCGFEGKGRWVLMEEVI